ncbi:MAG: DNA polymerase/3'-5' exonuclease PolX [Nitrospiraceae bacterium]|nr:MAG: DNA polymerase/3'-5' exonuclease PolX [Nitrospiraceae bacterium]
MPVHNAEIAEMLNEVADLLEIQGANQFRIRAYRNAARMVADLTQGVSEMIKNGEDLAQLPGIGKDLAGKITEIVESGKLGLLDELKKDMPGDLSGLMRIDGLGPKRVKVIYEKLGVSTLQGLEKAARDKKIRELPGLGEKTELEILTALKRVQEGKKRLKLPEADETAKLLLAHLKEVKGIRALEAAGSYRRRKETVGDLDILASVKKGTRIMDHFVNYEDTGTVISRGETRSSILLRSGFQVDLRVVEEGSYGAALQYFTGSKAHNIAIRKMGVQKGLKINEYGVFRGRERVAGKTEADVYKTVGLPYIEPELREDRGEIEAAQKKKLPRLVTLDDIRGDLHVHTKLTDGHSSLQEMAEAAQKRGYEYLAITEHSQRVTVAGGIDKKALARQIKEIDALNSTLKGFTILKGIEVDILEDGSLDLPDDILKELDVVVCSVHYKFNLPERKQTGRIIRAMDNKYFHIFAHPSGRLINERDPYPVDMEKIMEEAKDRGCFLELNAHPDRLDLTDIYCKTAKGMGVKVAISTDAHSINSMDFMRYGIGQARRGWLEADDVINTRSLKELKKLLKR